MRYWRLVFVSFLLTISIAGCHRKPVRALPPQHAQAPVIGTVPALPPLTLKPVQLQQRKPAPTASPSTAVAPPPTKHAKKVRHRRPSREESEAPSTEAKPAASNATPPPAAALIGKLSAEDSTATPADAAETGRLIDSTEAHLKKISPRKQSQHKDAIAQVESFLAQARQALSMNDVVGAQTLANKAKILLGEMSK